MKQITFHSCLFIMLLLCCNSVFAGAPPNPSPEDTTIKQTKIKNKSIIVATDSTNNLFASYKIHNKQNMENYNIDNILYDNNKDIIDIISLLLSIIAIILSLIMLFANYKSLNIAIYRWHEDKLHSEKAIINALFEELRNNINLGDGIMYAKLYNDKCLGLNETNKYNDILYLYRQLDHQNITYKLEYVNPTHSDNPSKHYLRKNTFLIKPTVRFTASTHLIKYTNNAKTEMLASGTAANILTERIFYNLGHLHYSVERHNANIEHFNEFYKSNRHNYMKRFIKIREDYMNWLHYRIYFLYLDMIDLIDIDYFIDKKFVCEEIVKYNRLKKKFDHERTRIIKYCVKYNIDINNIENNKNYAREEQEENGKRINEHCEEREEKTTEKLNRYDSFNDVQGGKSGSLE